MTNAQNLRIVLHMGSTNNMEKKMVKIQDAAIYSTGGAMAYELTYSEGTKVRAVESRDGFIRKECHVAGAWALVGKPYVVKHSTPRAAEQIKRDARAFIAA